MALDPEYAAAMLAVSIAYAQEKNDAEALPWLQRAAERGLAPAQYNLAMAFWQGHLGLKPDMARTLALLEEAIRQGFSPAQTMLADHLASGPDGTRDYVRAMELYRQAAEKQDSYAFFGVGRMYDEGLGVPADKVEAFNWFSKAAVSKFLPAVVRTAEMLAAGEGTTKNIPKAIELYRVAAGQALPHDAAMQWWERAAALGDTRSQVDLGRAYYHGSWGVQKDPAKAAHLFGLAAAKNDPEGLSALGDAHWFAVGVKKDEGRARRLWEQAANRGSVTALNQLAFMSYFRKDMRRAIAYYEKAAAAGDAFSMTRLADLYFEDASVQPDFGRALDWALKAVDTDPDGVAAEMAWQVQGRLQEKGYPSGPDYEKAAAMYRLAGTFGDEDLGRLYASGLAKPPPPRQEEPIPVPRIYSDSTAFTPEPRSPPGQPPRAQQTLASVLVSVMPASVRRGEVVELVLNFEIGATSSPVKVTESRELIFGGSALPNFPLRADSERMAGAHETRFSQKIPIAAAPGIYTFKGEVCAGGDCISRTATFEVVP
jgi:TPR repeat protein